MHRIRDHLGAEPTRLPVVVEEFDPFEQPNLQRALDDYVAGEGRQTTLVGLAAENKRFVAVGLSDLLGRGGSFLAEGPVVELPLPDAEGRPRLFALYAKGVEAEHVDWATFVERTEGASPAHIKEVLRKAVLLAAEAGGDGAISDETLEAAMDELAEGGRLAERILGRSPGAPESQPPVRPGFPQAWRRS